MNPLQPFFDECGFVVLDGGLASELEQRGADLNHDLWSARLVVEDPQAIIDVHRAYYEAGADLAISASYQASLDGFIAWGASPEDAGYLLTRCVDLARTARDQFWTEHSNVRRVRPLVAASVGPYGAVIGGGSEYRGHYGLTAQQLRDWHRPRLRRLIAGGADLLAIETCPSVMEAEVLAELLAEEPGVHAWMSFVCRNEKETCEGQAIEEAAAVAAAADSVVAVGVNCTAPEYIEMLLQRVASVTEKPLVAYPNRGGRWNAENRVWESNNASSGRLRGLGEGWSARVAEWYRAGARLIGGCCRTTPRDIREISASLEALTRGSPE